MKILGYLPGAAGAKSELLRAARVLKVELDQALAERQVIRLAERSCDAGESVLVVTTDQELSLIRELQARTPHCKLLLLSERKLAKLPYFLTSSPVIDGFFFSRAYSCGADFFVHFLDQHFSAIPFSMDRYLGRTTATRSFEIAHTGQRQGLLQEAEEFYEWCIGDTADLGLEDQVRQLQDSLDELVTNALRHGQAPGGRVQPACVEIAFDGTFIGTRVIDYGGLLCRKTILRALASDYNSLQHSKALQTCSSAPEDSKALPGGGIGLKMILEKQQRVIFHLRENVSTEVICFTRLPKRFRDFHNLPTSLEIRIWDAAD